MQGEKSVALITGSSGGIGFDTAVLLARNGFHTYASMRNLEKSIISFNLVGSINDGNRNSG